MKRHSEAVARNSVPIAQVLEQELPTEGLVLEIASGTGEHAVFFARRFPNLRWQPSDAVADALSSIEAWRTERGPSNLLPPLTIDAQAPDWPITKAAAVLCINMTHISPWSATEGLFGQAAAILPPNGPLILYGPYIERDVQTSVSNLAFDAGLRARNPQWGLRDANELDVLGARHGLARTARHALPANNVMLIYRR